MTTFSPSLICWPFQLRVTRRGAAGSAQTQGTSAAPPRPRPGPTTGHPATAASARDLPSARACRCRNVAFVESLPAAINRKKPITISCSSSFSPSTSACHQHARQILRRLFEAAPRSGGCIWRTPRGRLSRPRPGSRRGLRSRSPAPSIEVISRAPHRVVLLVDAHEAPNHPRHDRPARPRSRGSHSSRPVETIEQHAPAILADRLLVVRDPLRREAALEQRLQTVVLGRVHADEHRLCQLQREAAGGRQHAARVRRRTSASRGLTAWMSSAVVTDQKPSSSGNSSNFAVQCTGHFRAHLAKTPRAVGRRPRARPPSVQRP